MGPKSDVWSEQSRDLTNSLTVLDGGPMVRRVYSAAMNMLQIVSGLAGLAWLSPTPTVGLNAPAR
jgi:hypothetical protein